MGVSFVDRKQLFYQAKEMVSPEAAGKMREEDWIERCPSCTRALIERGIIAGRVVFECPKCVLAFVSLVQLREMVVEVAAPATPVKPDPLPTPGLSPPADDEPPDIEDPLEAECQRRQAEIDAGEPQSEPLETAEEPNTPAAMCDSRPQKAKKKKKGKKKKKKRATKKGKGPKSQPKGGNVQ